MPSGISYSDVESWLHELPGRHIESVEQQPDRNTQFTFRVQAHGQLSAAVAQIENGGPLELVCKINFKDDALEAIENNRRDFLREIDAVLTTAPGFHDLLGENGDPASRDDFTSIELSHWIYADGLTQHVLATAIIDLFSAANYVWTNCQAYIDGPGYQF